MPHGPEELYPQFVLEHERYLRKYRLSLIVLALCVLTNLSLTDLQRKRPLTTSNRSGLTIGQDASTLSNLSCYTIGYNILRTTESHRDQCCQSAQVFADKALYNINWGYSNCKQSTHKRPDQYGGYPGGVNPPQC